MKKFSKDPEKPSLSFEEIANDYIPTDDETRHMVNLLERMEKLTGELYASYARVQTVNSELSELRRKTIPNFADQIGMHEYKLGSGKRAEIVKEIQANISKENEESAFSILESSGAGSLIKNTLTINFDRTQEDSEEMERIQKILDEHSVDYEIKKTIHSSTLKSHVKSCREKGIQLDERVFGIFEVRDTRIDGKKVPKISNTPLKGAVYFNRNQEKQ